MVKLQRLEYIDLLVLILAVQCRLSGEDDIKITKIKKWIESTGCPTSYEIASNCDFRDLNQIV